MEVPGLSVILLEQLAIVLVIGLLGLQAHDECQASRPWPKPTLPLKDLACPKAPSNPKGPKDPNIGYVGFLYWES